MKKDWLSDSRLMLFALIGPMIFFMCHMLINAYIANWDLGLLVMNFEGIFRTLSIFLFVYPFRVLIGVSPKRGGIFNAQVPVAHLPYSTKELFLKGIKPWIIGYPIFLVGGLFLFYWIDTANFHPLLMEIIGGIIVIGSILVQLMCCVIVSLSRQKSILLLLLVFGLIDLVIMIFSLVFLSKVLLGVAGCLLIVSFTILIFQFKNIEKIYQ